MLLLRRRRLRSGFAVLQYRRDRHRVRASAGPLPLQGRLLVLLLLLPNRGRHAEAALRVSVSLPTQGASVWV